MDDATRRRVHVIGTHFDVESHLPSQVPPPSSAGFDVQQLQSRLASTEAQLQTLHARHEAETSAAEKRIARLEGELDPAVFLRVHRSVILRRETIIGLSRDSGGHWNARLSDGGEQRIGRSYAENVRRMAGRG